MVMQMYLTFRSHSNKICKYDRVSSYGVMLHYTNQETSDGLSCFMVLHLMILRPSLKKQCALKCDAVCSGTPHTSTNVSERPAACTLTSEHNLELEELRHSKALVYSNESVLGHVPAFSRLKFMG